jgi:hypothetical protein
VRSDAVTPDLHRKIVQRDGCLMARFDRSHQCRDRWGNPHGPWDLDKLTVEHVWMDSEKLPGHFYAAKGKKAPNSEFTLVGLCGALNGGSTQTPTAAFRVYAREYLIAKRHIAEEEARRAQSQG